MHSCSVILKFKYYLNCYNYKNLNITLIARTTRVLKITITSPLKLKIPFSYLIVEIIF